MVNEASVFKLLRFDFNLVTMHFSCVCVFALNLTFLLFIPVLVLSDQELEFYGPVNTVKVMLSLSWSVYLLSLFLGRLSALNS